MSTTLTLNVPRKRMIENRWDCFRHARDIPSDTSKNLFWKSPHTGSWILPPIQSTTEFFETSNWDSLKFRLSDVSYLSDWWTEYYENYNTTYGKYDYFFSSIVSSSNYSTSGFSLENMGPNGSFPTIPALKLQQQNGIPVIVSNAQMPANQGFTLRFRLEGRGSYARGAILDFWFGQFVLRLNTDGSAQLFQTTALNDGAFYAYVFSFAWTLDTQVHDRWHAIHILPHARNKIEFLARSSGLLATGSVAQGLQDLANHAGAGGGRGSNGGGLYELPGDVSTRTINGGTINQVYQITQANNWALRVSSEFRHHIQVSRTGFGNGLLGTLNAAYVFDTVQDPGFVCNLPLAFHPDIDLPLGCAFSQNCIDPTKTIFLPLVPPIYSTWTPPAQSMQYWISFQGGGVVPNASGGQNGCLTTPEFYGYMINKPMKFYTETITPVSVTSVDTLLTVSMNNGATAEQEHMVVTLLNNAGQVDKFCNQGSINVEMTDTPTGNLLFEGVAFGQSTPESPSTEASILTLPVVGMADRLNRAKWGYSTPNFESKNPAEGGTFDGWLITDVINCCFNQAGFDNSEVVIEDRKYYFDPSSANPNGFRIWTGQDAGGAKAGASKAGQGHETDAQPLGRFQPIPGAPVVDFLDWLLRDILGWHYERGTDRKWHVYKRPDPTSSTDVQSGYFNPKVAFYHTQTKADLKPDNLPAYAMLHPNLGPIHRPRCSTIRYNVIVNPPPSSALIQQLMNEGVTDATTSSDPGFVKKAETRQAAATNWACFENQYNTPPNTNSVDYIGEPVIEDVLSSEGLNPQALQYAVRRLFQDNCRGWTPYVFEAPWGDVNTYQLRKYDTVLCEMQVHDGAAKPHYNMVKCTIENVEPIWSSSTGKQGGSTRRMAQYSVVVLRLDGPPPR